MFCAKCGKEINDNVKFCPNCGFENTKNKTIKIDNTKNVGNDKPRPYKPLLIVVLALLVVIASISAYFLFIKKDDNNDNNILYASLIENINNAYDYFKENLTIINTVRASSSTDLLSEEGIIRYLSLKGINPDIGVNSDIFYRYSLSGEETENTKVKSSNDTHPEYISYYKSTYCDDVWAIVVAGDDILAISTASSSDPSKQTILIEKDYITIYDNKEDTFIQLEVNDNSTNIVKVDEINIDVLEEYSYVGSNSTNASNNDSLALEDDTPTILNNGVIIEYSSKLGKYIIDGKVVDGFDSVSDDKITTVNMNIASPEINCETDEEIASITADLYDRYHLFYEGNGVKGATGDISPYDFTYQFVHFMPRDIDLESFTLVKKDSNGTWYAYVDDATYLYEENGKLNQTTLKVWREVVYDWSSTSISVDEANEIIGDVSNKTADYYSNTDKDKSAAEKSFFDWAKEKETANIKYSISTVDILSFEDKMIALVYQQDASATVFISTDKGKTFTRTELGKDDFRNYRSLFAQVKYYS